VQHPYIDITGSLAEPDLMDILGQGDHNEKQLYNENHGTVSVYKINIQIMNIIMYIHETHRRQATSLQATELQSDCIHSRKSALC